MLFNSRLHNRPNNRDYRVVVMSMMQQQQQRHSFNVRTSWNLKSCPRCGGDMFLDDSLFTCLQCGYTLEIEKQKKNEGEQQLSHYKDLKNGDSLYKNLPPTRPLAEDRIPNFKDDIVVKLAMGITQDSHNLSMKVVQFLEARHFPITSDNVNKVYSSLLTAFPQVPESITQELQLNLDIEHKKIGTLLRFDYLLGKTQTFIIVDNKERLVSTPEDIDSQGLAIKQYAVCPNPYCNLVGQFYFTGKDGKYDYYCPQCKITWHIEWR